MNGYLKQEEIKTRATFEDGKEVYVVISLHGFQSMLRKVFEDIKGNKYVRVEGKLYNLDYYKSVNAKIKFVYE